MERVRVVVTVPWIWTSTQKTTKQYLVKGIIVMARSGHDPAVGNRIKVGKPRTAKRFRTKSKASYGKTVRSGSGRKVR
jgi:hypothetical protein